MAGLLRWLTGRKRNLFQNISGVYSPTNINRLSTELKIDKVWTEYRHFLNVIKTNTYLLNKLREKQAIVGNMLSLYDSLWRNLDHNDFNADTLRKLLKIHEQVQLVLQVMNEFILRRNRAQALTEVSIAKVTSHFELIEQYMRIAKEAKTYKQFECIPVPNMEWVNTFEDPKIKKLVKEWDDMKLQRKMGKCLASLASLVPYAAAA